jgi:acid phosphatase
MIKINGAPGLTRRQFGYGAAASGLTLALGPTEAQAQAELNFLVVGDWGRGGLSNQQAVADSMGRAAAQRQAAFVISTGDNFYDDGVASIDDPQWQTSFEKIYTAPSLQKPWWVVLGNHDYHGSVQAQIDYTAKSPRWRMPARNWQETMAAADVTFFFTDTSPFVRKYSAPGSDTKVAGQDPRAQLAWLETALLQSKSAWKFVVGHHPVFSGGSKHGDTRELVDVFPGLFKRTGVQAYFCGHEHDLQHIERDGIAYIVSGAGSEVRPTGSVPGSKFAVAEPGFVSCALAPSGMRVDFITTGDKIAYSAAIKRG